jgi:hypothetical protein
MKSFKEMTLEQLGADIRQHDNAVISNALKTGIEFRKAFSELSSDDFKALLRALDMPPRDARELIRYASKRSSLNKQELDRLRMIAVRAAERKIGLRKPFYSRTK